MMNSYLFHKDEIDGADNEEEGEQVVPVQILTLEHDVGNHGKNTKTDALLDDLQLHEIERATITIETDAVGGHLTAIFKQSDTPRKGDNANQGPVSTNP